MNILNNFIMLSNNLQHSNPFQKLFKGTFYHCEGPFLKDIKNKTDCLNMGYPYKWTNRKYNFDDLGQVNLRII